MALAIAPVLKIVKIIAPTVGPEATKLARKLVSDRQLKRQAHDMAWERGGKVGEVTFLDGEKRWVVVDQVGKPVVAVPPYGDGGVATLVEALAGVDFGRCMHAPDPELKAEKKHRKAEKKSHKGLANAAKA